jgi:nucleoside-diphosphate-sugar epimerase
MKIAVTGATGFLGRHVIRALSKRAELDVVGISRRPPDAASWPPAVKHVCSDLARSGAECFDVIGRPDLLIHLAWSGLPNYKSLHHFEEHLGEQYRFLSALVRAGLRSLVCTGTCFEYGMRSGELDESVTPDPCNPYSFAKDALRRQLELLRAAHPFELTWARLFYMFGEGQACSSLYPQLLAAGQRGDLRFGMSPGDQLRDYLPVTDVAQLIVRLACDAAGAGIVNVCSGRPTSVRSLAESWIRQHGWHMTLDLGRYPYADYEPMAFWGSNARLIRLLGSTTTAA